MTPYPTSFPAQEIATCIEHVVSGTGDVEEVKHAAWECAGYFLGVGSTPANPTVAKGAKSTGTDAEKLKFAADCRAGNPQVSGWLPAWLMPLILQLLQGFLKP